MAWLTDDDLPVALLLLAFAVLACTMPAQADTFYHLRSGQLMWQSGWFLDHEPFSHTSYGQPLLNHWWLSQLAFYALYNLGGPVLLTIVSGACVLTALLMSWRLTRGDAEVRLVLLIALALTLPEWSVRPQVFSMLLLMVTVRLVLADRLAWVPVVLLLWANAHAMVIFGIVVAGVVVIEALLWSRDRLPRALVTAVIGAAVPMLSPLGVHYWPRLVQTVSESRLLGIDEYRSPLTGGLSSVPFWLFLAAFAIVAGRALKTFAARDRADRLLLLTAGILAIAATISTRNVGFFALVAVPALSRLLPAGRTRQPSPAAWPARVLVVVAVIIGSATAIYRWRDGGGWLGWKPISAAAVAAVRACPAPIYNGFSDGGVLIWFVPEQRVFMDGRVEAYPVELLLRGQHADLTGDYRSLFTQYAIRCAVVRSESPMAWALSSDRNMPRRFVDSEWSVFGF